MNYQLSRRAALAAGSSVLLGALTGCSQLQSDSSLAPELEVLPSNYTQEQQMLELTLLQSDGETRDEAVVFDREFELKASEDGSSIANPPVVEDERYVVRASVGGYRDVYAHYHHYPDPADSEEGPQLLEVAIFSEDGLVRPYIDFTEYAGRRD